MQLHAGVAVYHPQHGQGVYKKPPFKRCAGEAVTQHLAEKEGEVEAHLASFVFREGSWRACSCVVNASWR